MYRSGKVVVDGVLYDPEISTLLAEYMWTEGDGDDGAYEITERLYRGPNGGLFLCRAIRSWRCFLFWGKWDDREKIFGFSERMTLSEAQNWAARHNISWSDAGLVDPVAA